MKNNEAFFHPNEAFLDYRNLLIEQYLNDYGDKYLSTIVERMNNTIYIFDSNPVENMKYLLEHEERINDQKWISLVEKEYKDWISVKKKMERSLFSHFYDLFLSYHHAPFSTFYRELLYFDFASFSNENMELLKRNDICSSVKEGILNRQKRYLEECKMYHMTPILDGFTIFHLERLRETLFEKEREILLQHTKWGKRVCKKIQKNSPFMISYHDIASFLFIKEPAVTTKLYNNRKNITICYFPVIQNTKIKEMDSLFFHENRHVVEMGDTCCGIDCNYEMLNEIRTEKNACFDVCTLKNKPLFSNESFRSDYYSVYQSLFPYTGSFFEEWRDFINVLAIENNISYFEKFFGIENLITFNQYLLDLEKQCIENHGIIPKESKCKRIFWGENFSRQA